MTIDGTSRNRKWITWFHYTRFAAHASSEFRSEASLLAGIAAGGWTIRGRIHARIGGKDKIR